MRTLRHPITMFVVVVLAVIGIGGRRRCQHESEAVRTFLGPVHGSLPRSGLPTAIRCFVGFEFLLRSLIESFAQVYIPLDRLRTPLCAG